VKQLVIASGKGGTGKTSIMASFAVLAEPLVLVDADVDAADLHLLLNPRVQHEEDFIGGIIARLDPERCTQCMECEGSCRYGALILKEGEDFRVDETACEGCGVCARVCPVEAIDILDNVNGRWFKSETDYGPMFHARLGIAEENSGKLVALLRQQAKEIAERDGHELIMVDGPPGIGCPVMASVTGADMIVFVAEPTISGRHDLGRVADLAAHFKIPAVAIINKCDINPDMARELREDCDGRGVEVIAEVPYDSDVTGAIVAARPLVEYSDGPASAAVKAAWESLAKKLA